jgi:hypothetical protein
MNKVLSLSLVVVMLFAFGSALYFTEQNLTKVYADPAACTQCWVSCEKISGVCYLKGEFCLDATYLDNFYFFYKIPGQAWPAGTKLSPITHACNDGCTGYKINNIAVTCNTTYDCRICYGSDPTQNIQCEDQVICPR